MQYTSKNPITTQLQGYLLDPMKNPLVGYTITAEATDSFGSAKGLRASYKTGIDGFYKFYLVEGNHNFYLLKDSDSTEQKIGSINVKESDLNKVYTLQELLNKWVQ